VHAIIMVIVMVSNTFKVKQLVPLLFVVGHQNAHSCKSQRLPAHAKKEKHSDQSTAHSQILAVLLNRLMCITLKVSGFRGSYLLGSDIRCLLMKSPCEPRSAAIGNDHDRLLLANSVEKLASKR